MLLTTIKNYFKNNEKVVSIVFGTLSFMMNDNYAMVSMA